MWMRRRQEKQGAKKDDMRIFREAPPKGSAATTQHTIRRTRITFSSVSSAFSELPNRKPVKLFSDSFTSI